MMFTFDKNDLTEFERIEDIPVEMANKSMPLCLKGKGAVFFTHKVKRKGRTVLKTSHLYPVYWIPNLSLRLLSVGTLLSC